MGNCYALARDIELKHKGTYVLPYNNYDFEMIFYYGIKICCILYRFTRGNFGNNANDSFTYICCYINVIFIGVEYFYIKSYPVKYSKSTKKNNLLNHFTVTSRK